MTEIDDRVCGRCGVYFDYHPTEYCTTPRRSWPWSHHDLRAHALAWAWIHVLSSRTRWALASWFSRRAGRCWCVVVDGVRYADDWTKWSDDYRHPNCLCDFPVPWAAVPASPGWCICQPLDK